MNIQIFVSLAKRGDEVVLLGIGTNSRLVETQRDSFIMRPDNIDYESQTQIHKLEVGWKVEKIKQEVINDIHEEKTISDERENFYAKVSRKTES